MVAEAYLLPLPTADPGTWALMSPAQVRPGCVLWTRCNRFECLQLRARAQKSRIMLTAQSALTQCRKSAFIFEIPICV